MSEQDIGDGWGNTADGLAAVVEHGQRIEALEEFTSAVTRRLDGLAAEMAVSSDAMVLAYCEEKLRSIERVIQALVDEQAA